MARRGDRFSAKDALQGLGQISDLVKQPAAAGAEGKGMVQLPIAELFPDPVQARRVLPAGLRGRFLAGELGAVEALLSWQEMAENDAIEIEVLESRVLRLARSLQAQEQINPVTVNRVEVKGQTRYMLETGERRWWAHWWLVGVEGDERFQNIQAVIVESPSPWRQAAENLQGEPLSAVQEACQVARLVLLESDQQPEYELGWSEKGLVVELGAAERGYDFYRLVRSQRIPAGTWPLIEQATGKGTRYCQFLLRLLDLDDRALEAADRANLSESQLRPLAAGEQDPERQARIVELATRYNLGRDEVASLVRARDLGAAEARLQQRATVQSTPPAIRPPEQIVLDRLGAMNRLLDRASRSEPAMVTVLAQQIARQDDAVDRRAELQGLYDFLGSLLSTLDQTPSP